MLRVRCLLVWLIVAVIPLQGLAAVSMLLCETGVRHAPAQVAAAHHEQLSSAGIASGPYDPSQHSHADGVQVKKAGENTGNKLPDSAHKCGVCASCCHSVAITEFPSLLAFAPLPQAEWAEPFVLIQPRPSSVPDKPPRA